MRLRKSPRRRGSRRRRARTGDRRSTEEKGKWRGLPRPYIDHAAGSERGRGGGFDGWKLPLPSMEVMVVAAVTEEKRRGFTGVEGAKWSR